MARPLLTTALIGGVLAVACASTSSTNKPAQSPEPTPMSPAEMQNVNVTNLYNDTCAKCHGVNAEGGGGGTKSLLTGDKFDQKWDKPFFDAIKNGVPDAGMEAYGKTMSDEVIWAMVVHIREAQGKNYRATKGSSKADANGNYTTKLEAYKVETVLDHDLQTPWCIDWLPDGRMLVTNRPGSIVLVGKDGSVNKIDNLPKSVEQGQGGMMDVAVHPSNGWVYLSIADPKKDGRGALTKIVRGKFKLDGNKATWSDEQTIFEADQKFYNGQGIHFGGKIVFDKKGHIYFSVGERGGNMLAQETTNPYGKIYRLNEDGSVPGDNPFKDEPGLGGMWTFGHRNPQGLTIDLEGNVWDTEHGPRGGDEVNWIQKGHNYGWPVVAFSINYNDSPFHTPWPKEDQDITLPIFRWLPSTGASGLDVYDGSAFKNWKGDLLAGGLVGQNLDRIRIKNGKLVEQEELLHGMGRIRDIKVGKDGFVYIALNQPDKVIRLVPAK